MKKILIGLFLLVGVMYSQVTVVGDTTDLKNTYGSGLVILEKYAAGTTNGGGLFHRIDSTYVEGTHAFDHPNPGSQWARINLIDQYMSLGSSNNDVTIWNTNKYTPVALDSLFYLILGNNATRNLAFGVDSSKGVVLSASDSTQWRIKVSPSGALSADSTGLN